MESRFDPRSSQLEAIWEQYSRRLLAFIRSRVPGEADAEDLLQEVFVRIHLNLCCLRDRSRLESWVFQITRHAIIDYYRARREEVAIPESLAVEEAAGQEAGLERELAPSLKGLVEGLPPAYREALLLVDYGGMSQKALAQQLGLSLSGAKSRVQRARQMVREMLLACCHFELDRYGRVIAYQERCCCCHPVD